MDIANNLLGEAVRKVRSAEDEPSPRLLQDVHGGISEGPQASYTNRSMASLGTFLDSLTEMRDETRAKYEAELANASPAWRRPLEYRYAESLVGFGLLERLTKVKKRGSRSWFRLTTCRASVN